MKLKFSAIVGQLGSPGGVNPLSEKIKKPKVFVTEGKDVALTGVCVFFIRTDPSRAITPENIHRVRGKSSPLPPVAKSHINSTPPKKIPPFRGNHCVHQLSKATFKEVLLKAFTANKWTFPLNLLNQRT